MSINTEVFLKLAPRLVDEGLKLVPCYNKTKNVDFKALNKKHPILPKNWNAYENNPYLLDGPAISGADYDHMLACMVLVTPGFVVLDLDRKDEEQALLADKVLTELKPFLPKTLVIRTASGGYHFYYRTKRKVNASKYRDVIDIQQESLRGKGAGKTGRGVWAPGCVRHNVGQYSLAIDAPMAYLPEETIELLEAKIPSDDAKSMVVPDEETRIELWPDRISMGDRNNALYKICGSFYGRGIDKPTVVKIMKAIVRESVDNSDGEINEDTIESMVERTYTQDNAVPDRSMDMIKYCLDRFIHEKANNRVIDLHDGSIHKFGNARNVFANFVYEYEQNEKVKLLPALDAWVKHPKKRVVMYIGYKPKADLVYKCPRSGMDMYNQYIYPQFHELETEDEEAWKQFKWLCAHLIPEMPEYLLNYAAYMVQKPDRKLSVATVIFSEHRGVGKNLFFDILSNLVGRDNSAAGSINDFLDKFNYQLATAHNILVDEAEHRPTPNQMARFKSLITEDFVKIEQKGIDSYIIPAYFNFLVFSNQIDKFPLEVGDRRFNVFACPNTSIPDKRMRELTRLGTNKMNLPEGMNHQGLATLVKRLKEHRIDEAVFGGHVRAMNTRTKQLVRESSLSEIVQDLINDIKQHIGAFKGDIVTKPMIRAHCARYYNREIDDLIIRELLVNSGHLAKLPYSKHPNQPRQITVPQFFIDKLMYLKSDVHKQVACFICRDHIKYSEETPTPVIRAQYMKGYDEITGVGGDSTVPLVDPTSEDLSDRVH